MFAWICPTCGKDVPPSKTECPYCAAAGQQQPPAPAATGQMPAWRPPAPPQPPPPPPPQAYPPQAYPPQAYAPPQQPYPPQGYPPQPAAAWPPPGQSAGTPTWLMGLGFAAVFMLVLGGAWYFLSGSKGSEGPVAKSPQAVAGKKGGNPLQRQIEVTGLRFITQDKAPAIRFVVINHSGAEVAGLSANVTLSAGTSRSDEDAIGNFHFTLESIGPGESKELTAALKTKLKPYELPDWQNANTDVDITSPAP